MSDFEKIYNKLEKMDDKFDKKFDAVNEKIHKNRLETQKEMNKNQIEILNKVGNVNIKLASIMTITSLFFGTMGAWIKSKI